MSGINHTEFHCPIWGNETDMAKIDNGTDCETTVYSPRAGGIFQIEDNWPFDLVKKKVLGSLTPREKANLSYRIYRHNWDGNLLCPQNSDWQRSESCWEGIKHPSIAVYALKIDKNYKILDLQVQPSIKERLITFVRELIWQKDRESQFENLARKEASEYHRYLMAAGACASQDEFREFFMMALDREWMTSLQTGGGGKKLSNHQKAAGLCRYGYEEVSTLQKASVTLKARMWVEEEAKKQGISRQGFVAMWFDESLRPIYENGFRKAIVAAGYEACRIDDNPYHSDKIDDRILAEIRQSRFVVADFTNALVKIPKNTQINLNNLIIQEQLKSEDDQELETVALARGSVYFEAGFAEGLGIQVIYTCHKDAMDFRHFDTLSINHLVWSDTEDLVKKLQAHIERRFGQGPEKSVNT